MKEAEKVEKKEIRLQTLFLTQDLLDEHWAHFTNVKKYDAQQLLDKIVDLFRANDIIVKEACAIIHNKDEKEIGDIDDLEMNDKTIIAYKHHHLHAYIKLDKRVALSKISATVGVEAQYIEALKKGRYGVENVLAYLIHAKDSNKYLYNAREVACYNFDYLKYYAEHKQKWSYARATKSKKTRTVNKDYLIEQVTQGKLTKEQIMLTDDYRYTYSKHIREFEDAFRFYADYRMTRALHAMKHQNFQMSVIYISGKSGAGKTRAALQLANVLREKRARKGERWDVFNAGATNPFDSYGGEEIVILDDLRASSMSASDWLKLLDPHTVSESSARYQNKTVVARTIFITSYLEPEQFFYYVRGNAGQDEALDQFIRRLAMIMQVIRVDDVNEYQNYFNEVGTFAQVRDVVRFNKERQVKIEHKDVKNNRVEQRDVSLRFGASNDVRYEDKVDAVIEQLASYIDDINPVL